MKNFFTLILAALLPLMANAYDAEIDGIYYNFSGNEATVTSGSPKYSGAVVIPESVTYNANTYNVTSIGSYAFRNCSGLTSVTIPGSVTSIGSYAFRFCSSLTSITIPNSVTSIGGWAFQDCSSLTSITIPESVASIGDYAFDGCSGLTSVTIPGSVTSIGEGAFFACEGLTSVTILDGVTSIGDYAFTHCNGLTTITIPNSVTSIGGSGSAFSECSSLTSVKVDTGNTTYDSRNDCNAIIETASNTLIFGCQNTVIPNTVTSIGPRAFIACSGLTSITIPESVTSIGFSSFYYCRNLTTIDSYINEPFTFGEYTFMNINEEAVLTVPQGTRDAYLAAGWTEDVFRGGVVERTGTNEVSISIADYATIYCAESDLTIPEGIQAFTGVIQGEWLSLNEVTGKIPAGTAIILKGEEGTYSFAYTTGAEPVGENDLKGTADPLEADGTQFILAKRESYGFFKATPGTTIPAGKAYLETTAQNVKGFLFHEDNATSINEELRMKNEESEADIYNLAGQRVNKAQKGIYIINGKKVLK